MLFFHQLGPSSHFRSEVKDLRFRVLAPSVHSIFGLYCCFKASGFFKFCHCPMMCPFHFTIRKLLTIDLFFIIVCHFKDLFVHINIYGTLLFFNFYLISFQMLFHILCWCYRVWSLAKCSLYASFASH